MMLSAVSRPTSFRSKRPPGVRPSSRRPPSAGITMPFALIFQVLPSRTWTLGIRQYVHPGRTRCMRHGLPHARRIGRGMLLLLLPLRAFGHGRTGKFVDRAVAAGTLENPIAAGGGYVPRPAGGSGAL